MQHDPDRGDDEDDGRYNLRHADAAEHLRLLGARWLPFTSQMKTANNAFQCLACGHLWMEPRPAVPATH